MYIDIKLCSVPGVQLKLHKKMRIKILEWERQGHLPPCGAELTYHPSADPSHLQAILNQPHIRVPTEQRKKLSQEEREQIREAIIEYVESLRNENQIKQEDPLIHDKEMDEGRMMERARGKEYYWGLSNEEIMEFCTHGTKIAFGILSTLEKDRESFKDDPALREYIREQIRQELHEVERSTNNPKFMGAWHETLNTLGIWGAYSYKVLLPNEEEMFLCSAGTDGLELIKARSLDYRMVFSNWKGSFLGFPWSA
nr:hypothetical protein [Candidatus Njordarchaeota archaeon]